MLFLLLFYEAFYSKFIRLSLFRQTLNQSFLLLLTLEVRQAPYSQKLFGELFSIDRYIINYLFASLPCFVHIRLPLPHQEPVGIKLLGVEPSVACRHLGTYP